MTVVAAGQVTGLSVAIGVLAAAGGIAAATVLRGWDDGRRDDGDRDKLMRANVLERELQSKINEGTISEQDRRAAQSTISDLRTGAPLDWSTTIIIGGASSVALSAIPVWASERAMKVSRAFEVGTFLPPYHRTRYLEVPTRTPFLATAMAAFGAGLLVGFGVDAMRNGGLQSDRRLGG